MIPANELRIGSIVNYKGEIIPLSRGFEVDRHNEIYEPIPLTPELLEKCGFTGQALGYWVHDVFKGIHVHAEDEGLVVYMAGGGRLVRVSSVHHLQNLYFDLTGTELKFKL
jgi:hypothetical protein